MTSAPMGPPPTSRATQLGASKPGSSDPALSTGYVLCDPFPVAGSARLPHG